MLSIEEKAKAVYNLLSQVYPHSPWQLSQIIADMQQEQVDYFLIFEGDLLVAFLAIQNLVGEIEITNIAVLPDYQGKGLASRLMGNLSDASESVFLEVRESNHKAQALYRKHGFECVGKRPNYYKEPAEAALIMKREGSHDR